MARLTDRLEGDSFDDVDRVCAQKFARHAEVALANALRFRALEKRSLEDPDLRRLYRRSTSTTSCATRSRRRTASGARFALLELDLGTLDVARREAGEAACRRCSPASPRSSRGCCAPPTCSPPAAPGASSCCSPRRTRWARRCSSGARCRRSARASVFSAARRGRAARSAGRNRRLPPRRDQPRGAAARARRARRGGAPQPRAPARPRSHDARRRLADAARGRLAGARGDGGADRALRGLRDRAPAARARPALRRARDAAGRRGARGPRDAARRRDPHGAGGDRRRRAAALPRAGRELALAAARFPASRPS